MGWPLRSTCGGDLHNEQHTALFSRVKEQLFCSEQEELWNICMKKKNTSVEEKEERDSIEDVSVSL